MFELQIPWHELVFRCILLYGFILMILRLTNREGGQISAIDQVVLFTIGDLIAAAAVKSDDSISAAFLAMSTFVGMSYLVKFLTFRSKKLERVVEGGPCVLVHNGEILWKNMRQELITKEELMSAIRLSGSLSIANIHVAMVEPNGTISVIKREDSGTQNNP